MNQAIAALTGLENPGPNSAIASVISQLTSATDTVSATLDGATVALQAALPVPVATPAA